MFDKHELFCDGGVIGRNPSTMGGTWAYRVLEYGFVVAETSGIVTPEQMQMPNITNNLTEMLALVRGMQVLPVGWKGTIISDSQITLGRAFQGWKWKNIPDLLKNEFDELKAKHNMMKGWNFVLVQGHPSKAELISGFGSKGYPVSENNKWCDEACQKQAILYREEQNVDYASQ